MHRLFWKIFLSFWGALILFSAAALFAASHYLDQIRQQRDTANPHADLRRNITAARGAADRGGIKGLKAWAERMDRQELIPMLVLNKNGRDLLKRSVPTGIQKRFQHVRTHIMRHLHRHRHRHFDPVIRLPEHKNYWLVPDFTKVTLERVLARPRVMLLPLVVAALVSGLVCLLLARYLTAPISRLRAATEAYASGDLSYRVMPTMGKRRDEIAELARAFDQMASRLHALMSTQHQLLRDVSHELRSPLARLEVALGLARQRAPQQHIPELARIEREAEHLNELIGGLLSLARFESGIAASECELMDLEEMLQHVIDDAAYEAQTQNKNVRMITSTPAVMRADPALLHSAIENVVRNAVRYTDVGTTVELSLSRHPHHYGWLIIEIRDHGPGVPEDVLPRLFEAFVRVGEARDRASGGYGLGLAIARQAIRLHDGKIQAHNVAGGGLSVVIDLPKSGPQATKS